MRGLLIGVVIALALYGLVDLAMRGCDGLRDWREQRRRRRSLRLAKRLGDPLVKPIPWVLVVAITFFILGLITLGLIWPLKPEALPPARLGEEIRFQLPKPTRTFDRPDSDYSWPFWGRVEATKYHPKYAGRTTASGAVYDPAKLTAAHRWLAFGDQVEVAGPAGSAVLTINDRGPFCVHGPSCELLTCRRADIDLSEAAARAIGMTGRGIVLLRRLR